MDKFIIAPQEEGLQRNVLPWLISDTAFQTLDNAYVFRGRVRRRVGEEWLRATTGSAIGTQFATRLRLKLGTTDGGGNLTSGTAPIPGAARSKAGVSFSLSTSVLTAVDATAGSHAMLTTDPVNLSGTFDATTNAYTIVGGVAYATTDVYYYPSEPVMGFVQYENDANLPTFAFDRQFAYQFTTSGWERLGTAVWTGSDSQFFWGTTWRGVLNNDDLLFVTNYKPYAAGSDGIQYWNGTVWAALNPAYNGIAGNTIFGARIIRSVQRRPCFTWHNRKCGGVAYIFP